MDMSDTPETDDQPIIYAMNDNGYQVPCVDLEFARRLKRERDEAREQNAKLRDIAERAIDYLNQSYRNGFEDEASDLRYELAQLKEETK
jgi:hypothetical protein